MRNRCTILSFLLSWQSTRCHQPCRTERRRHTRESRPWRRHAGEAGEAWRRHTTLSRGREGKAARWREWQTRGRNRGDTCRVGPAGKWERRHGHATATRSWSFKRGFALACLGEQLGEYLRRTRNHARKRPWRARHTGKGERRYAAGEAERERWRRESADAGTAGLVLR